jgi:RND superfamily putative drug exporter
MSRLARLGIRRPLPVLIVWGLLVVVLGLAGRGVEGKLKPTQLLVPGTEASRWNDLRTGHFGEEATVLLTGPASAIERQGPPLARALAARPNSRVLSPWAGGSGARKLRPHPDQALIVLDLDIPSGQTANDIVRPIERFVDNRISPPVERHIAGLAPLGRDINEATVNSIRMAELLTFPVLLIVLLLVFRTPIAALIPLCVAGATRATGFGVLAIITEFASLDSIAVSIASMIGLALGVDYSLLIVTRFREALHEGHSVPSAVTLAANTAGRTAVFAGVVLISIMLVTLVLSPGTVLLSAAVGAIVVTVLSMIGAALITPAALRLLGDRVNRWMIGGRRQSSTAPAGALGQAVARVSRRPLVAAPLALALLLALASPILALNTIPPDPRQLPKGSRGLEDFLQVRRAGFGPTVETVIKAPLGALTSPDYMRSIERFERRLARLPYVKFVVGPGALGAQTVELQRAPQEIQRGRRELARGSHDLARLAHGLGRAAKGVGALRTGLADAANAAAALADGSGRAAAASRQLAVGAGRAQAGARTVASGTAQSGSAAQRIVDGARRAVGGSEQLAAGEQRLSDQLSDRLGPGASALGRRLRIGAGQLQALHEPAQLTERQLGEALRLLNAMTVGKSDPRYAELARAVATAYGAATGRSPLNDQRLAPAYPGLATSVTEAASGADAAAGGSDRLATGAREAASGADRLSRGAGALNSGLRALRAGTLRLSGGLDALASGSPALAAGLTRVRDGAAALNAGLTQIQSGQGLLAVRLESGHAHSRPLETRLTRTGLSVSLTREQLLDRRGPFKQLKTLDRLESRSPGFFRSGYVTVAALQGAHRDQRRASLFLLDSNHGAQVGRVQLLPDVPTNDPRTARVVDAVTHEAHALAAHAHLSAAVGGSAGELVDYDRATKSRFPLLVLGVAFITYLLLIPILRSLVLPLVAVLLNLITVAVSFGVLTLLFVGSHPLLGGAGSIDVISLSGIFSITFALSIDYQVFLLTRMREGLVRTQDADTALRFGIEKTARVVTGAAAIMIAVFLAFALSDFSIIRQFGVGLATAVLIDATLVRLVLLPALMRLLGMNAWWIPRWLDDRLPVLDVDGGEFEQEARQMQPAV